jgi:DNA-directed RNA polymerase specialized sigma24 family protein
MENDDRLQIYEELIEKYSKAFYARVSSLFELEDLAQEMWKCILEVEAYEKERGTNRLKDKAFLVTCIRNHIINLIKAEFIRNKAVDKNPDPSLEGFESKDYGTEVQAISREQLALLAGEIDRIKDGKFVIEKTMQGLTVTEISDIGISQGLKMSKSKVNWIQHKIKRIANKLFLDISVL